MEDIEDAEFVVDKEVTNGAISIAEQASALVPSDADLPERDIRNDSPGFREKEEKSSLNMVTSSARKKLVEKAIQKQMYERRKRAKAVELKLLPAGRSSKGEREEWWKELEKREIKKFGEVQGDR